MARDVREILDGLPAARREKILEEAGRLEAEYLSLSALRRARELTQVQLARSLGKSQVSIARLEKRSDLLLSTLRGYVEAMGGRLNLTVEFPDRAPVQLESLGGNDGESGKARPGKDA